jgi:hypothetical protein
MDTFTISTRIRELQTALDAVEGISSRYVSLYFYGDGISAIRFEVEYRETDSYSAERHEFAVRVMHDEVADDSFDLDVWLDDAMHDAMGFIQSIPTQAEREHNAFIRQVGRLIDSGREVGIDVAFLNPLTDMMRKLSENVLEDKRNH